KRDYYYRSVLGRRLFSLDLGPVALAFAGMSSPADQRFLDELAAGTPVERFPTAILRHRGLVEAARSVEDASRSPGPYRS
ncbi:MAG TPA: hypothetical protein VHO06_18290, partial [Polyangia bacterium]|nr:hypothetical protein [Polyangia bacterium]